uniref:Uncharacterized protein n=1 Tax=Romanomermis culicivorax TaxID=13658 RepID=A0A915L7E9_ROMCU
MTIPRAAFLLLCSSLILRGNGQPSSVSVSTPVSSASPPISSASPPISSASPPISSASPPISAASSLSPSSASGRSRGPDQSPEEVDEDTWIILNPMEDLLRELNELLSILGLAASPALTGPPDVTRPTSNVPLPSVSTPQSPLGGGGGPLGGGGGPLGGLLGGLLGGGGGGRK